MNGEGIEEKELGRIFERFYKSSKSDKEGVRNRAGAF